MSDVINHIQNKCPGWLSGQGPDSDIVISSRVRLARNLHGFPFVDRLDEKQRKDVRDRILEGSRETEALGACRFIAPDVLDHLERRFFVERRLISPELGECTKPSGFLFGSDEKIGIMIHEEDHVRIGVLESGFSLETAWDRIKRIDSELAEHLRYATSDRFGYLTACPTNVGTGIRFSVFIHLPILTFSKALDGLFEETVPAGIAVRGFYGEGSQAVGNLFQISNQYTLGWTEQGILLRVLPLIRRFVDRENEARERIMNERRVPVEDMVYRALGILTHARILTSMEWLGLWSALRLGVETNFLPWRERSLFNELMVTTEPAHLQEGEGRTLTEEEMNIRRATLVREKLHFS
jgi:protein arginine kinase